MKNQDLPLRKKIILTIQILVFTSAFLTIPNVILAQIDTDLMNDVNREIARQVEEAQEYADSVRRFIGKHIANAYDEKMRNELQKYDQLIVNYINKNGARNSMSNTTRALNLAKRSIAEGKTRLKSRIEYRENLKNYESKLPEFIKQKNLVVNSWQEKDWPSEDNEAEYAQLKNNRYEIKVFSKSSWHYFTVPFELNNFQDFYLETSVQAYKSSNEFPYFGLMWGASGASEANLFLISPQEKLFTIGGVNFNELDLPNPYRSNHLNNGRSVNTIGVMNYNNSTIYFINRRAIYYTNRKEMIGNEFGFFIGPNTEIVANRFNIFVKN